MGTAGLQKVETRAGAAPSTSRHTAQLRGRATRPSPPEGLCSWFLESRQHVWQKMTITLTVPGQGLGKKPLFRPSAGPNRGGWLGLRCNRASQRARQCDLLGLLGERNDSELFGDLDRQERWALGASVAPPRLCGPAPWAKRTVFCSEALEALRMPRLPVALWAGFLGVSGSFCPLGQTYSVNSRCLGPDSSSRPEHFLKAISPPFFLLWTFYFV